MGKLTLTNVGSTPTIPPANHQSLFFDGTDGHFKKIDNSGAVTDLELGGSGATSLAALSDVDVSGATANDVLVYTGTTWSSAQPTLQDINDISNVNASGATVNDILVFDGENWVTGQPCYSTSIEDLTDVQYIGTPEHGQILVYDSVGFWYNANNEIVGETGPQGYQGPIGPQGNEGPQGAASSSVTRTLEELKTDITNAALIPGMLYEITGVHKEHDFEGFTVPALYDDGRGLGTTIYLRAVSTTELESKGSGVFYNPKYNKDVAGYGIWTNKIEVNLSKINGKFNFYDEKVTADNGATGRIISKGWIEYISGDWSNATSITGNGSGATADIMSVATPEYNINDIVFWGGYAWRNLNGEIGGANNVLELDGNEWEKLDYTNGDYYNKVIDVIEYDIEHDVITRRKDTKNDIDVTTGFLHLLAINPVSSISLMQWGNDLDISASSPAGIGKIKVGNTSYAELVNFRGGTMYSVSFDNYGYMRDVSFDNGRMDNVSFDNGGNMSNVSFDNKGNMSNVSFNKDGYMRDVSFDNGRMDNVSFDNGGNMSNVSFNKDGYMRDVSFDNGGNMSNVSFNNGRMDNVSFDNGGNMSNVSFDNKGNMSNVSFDNININFSNYIMTNKSIKAINFKGSNNESTIFVYPTAATKIFDNSLFDKRAFAIDNSTLKLQYWDNNTNQHTIVNI